MTIFNPNKPQAPDLLSDSQLDLLNNNQANNTWSMVDHYALDNMTPNNGFHTHVTSPTPASGMHYANPGINTILYGMNDTPMAGAGLGIGNIQYSRAPNNAVPSPVTTLQSSSASTDLINGSPQTVLEFNPSSVPIPPCYGIATAMGFTTDNPLPICVLTMFCWDGLNKGNTTNRLNTTIPGALTFVFSGTKLLISNGSLVKVTKLAWTVRFERIWITT